MARYILLALIATSGSAQACFGQAAGPTPPWLADYPGYELRQLQGFTAVISAESLKEHAASTLERKPLDVLDHEFQELVEMLRPEAVAILRKLPIVVEWNDQNMLENGRQALSMGHYNPNSREVLLRAGRSAKGAKTVTIDMLKVLAESGQPKRDYSKSLLLHEMSHAVHDQFFGFDHEPTKAAYRNAMGQRLYDLTAYITTNEKEFFAEATCAYYDQLGYYPKTREDLQKHDPVTYRLMEACWGPRETKSPAATTSPASTNISLRLEQIDFGKAVANALPTADSLRGRPSVIIAWNARDTGWVSKFSRWDTELRDFGLTTAAIHLTGPGQVVDVAPIVEERQMAFAVTNRDWTYNDTQMGFKDFPQCFVFDRAGKCVYQGTPFNAESPLRSVVAEHLLADLGTSEPPKALVTVAKTLREGKPPLSVLTPVIAATRSSDAATKNAAKELLTRLSSAADARVADAEAKATDSPVDAYVLVARIPQDYRGTPVASRALALLGKLRRDKRLAGEFQAQATFAQVQQLEEELRVRPGSFDPKLDTFQQANAPLLQQLKTAVETLQRNWPNTRSAAEGLKIAKAYGVGG